MTQQKSRLTIVLKVCSILVLLHTVYTFINLAVLYVNMRGMSLLIHVFNGEKLVFVAVSILLAWSIFTEKSAAALFLPCILLSAVSALVLLGLFTSLMYSDEAVNIAPYTLWYIVNSAVLLLIAVDARYGSRFALAELLALAALVVLQIIAGIVSLISLLRMSSNTAGLPAQIAASALKLVLAPPAVIVLFLLRVHILRKSEVPPC